MFKLGVNIDHVATLRQARGGKNPDPVRAALICQRAGAHSIVMHLREDRRHVQDADLFAVKKAVSIKLNMEMSIAPGIVRVAEKLVPDQVTLVPEKRMERTTEGGLDLFSSRKRLAKALDAFDAKKIPVSLFIDPHPRQIREAALLGVEAVEFHTGDYAHQATVAGRNKELKRLNEGVKLALDLGLIPHAGHGLDYENVAALKKIKGLDELNIGYSIVSRALWTGWESAVREMLMAIR